MGEIAVVVGDIGSAKEIVPAVKVLEARGIKVRWFADSAGKAKIDVLEKQGVAYEMVIPDGYKPSVIVVGTSATAAVLKVEFTKYGRENGIPVLWVEDLYGTGERQNSLGVSPDVMLVIDDIAAQIAKTVRPGLDVRVVGKPTFGKLPTEDEAKDVRNKIRESVGLNDSKFLLTVSFGGDPAERALAQLPEIVRAIQRDLSGAVTVAWRFHPKHPKVDELWKMATESGIKFVDARKLDIFELILASNCVVADWGNTDPYKGLLYGVPTITMLFPDDYERREGAGYPNGVPPIIASAKHWGARTPEDLTVLIYRVKQGEEAAWRYTRNERAKPFLALKQLGAEKNIADEILNAAK